MEPIPGPFLKQLVAWLEGKPHTQYSRLVEHGYVNTGRATACASLNHIDLIANNLGTSGTWQNPCIVEAGDFTSLPGTATLYSTAIASSSNPSGTPASSGSGSGSAPTTTLSKYELARFAVKPDDIADVDYEMFKDIVSCVPDRRTREAYAKAHGKSGRKLIKQLYVDAASSTANTAANDQLVLNEIATIEKVGIVHPSCYAYNTFKSTLEDKIDELSSSAPIAPAAVAQKLVTAARQLGDEIKKAVDSNMRTDKARGDLAKTHVCIIDALSTYEADNPTSTDGRGLAARGDALRQKRQKTSGGDNPFPGSSTPSKRTGKPIGKCPSCDVLGLIKGASDGEHWGSSCPNKEQAKPLLDARRAGNGNNPTAPAKSTEKAPVGHAKLVKLTHAQAPNQAHDAKASEKLFSSGQQSIVQLEDIDNPQALLARLATGTPGACDDDTGAPDDPGKTGKAHMVWNSVPYTVQEEEDDSSDSDDEEMETAPIPTRASAELNAMRVPMGSPVATDLPKLCELSPSSPMKDFHRYVNLAGSPAEKLVSLNCGGVSRRSRVQILAELHTAKGAPVWDGSTTSLPQFVLDAKAHVEYGRASSLAQIAAGPPPTSPPPGPPEPDGDNAAPPLAAAPQPPQPTQPPQAAAPQPVPAPAPVISLVDHLRAELREALTLIGRYNAGCRAQNLTEFTPLPGDVKYGKRDAFVSRATHAEFSTK